MLRSAWIKWARGVEHQKDIAREMREFDLDDSYEYVQWDNLRNPAGDTLVRMYWRLRVKKPFPERWSILLGDVVGDFRAALDHAMFEAVLAHSGTPEHPQSIEFPIYPKDAKPFRDKKKQLEPLVAPQVWKMVETLQPFHGGDRAHTSPIEILRWLSNRDKHRQVHVIGRTAVDMGPFHFQSGVPVEVVHEWRHTGDVHDGSVMGRLKFHPPEGVPHIDFVPTFAFEPSIQISDEPVEFRPLASAMDVIREHVLGILAGFAQLLEAPFRDGLELGEAHDAYAADRGGHTLFFTQIDGVRHRVQVPKISPDA